MVLREIIGYVLLILGLLLIFWTVYSSYNIFTAKTKLPEIFKVTEKTEGTQELEPQLEKQIAEVMGEQLKNILPIDFLPQLFNLIAWSIFAGISIFAGTQISGLGIKLIKK